MVDIIKSQLENSGEIKDISALARKRTEELLPYGMKILFAKKSVDTDLPRFFVHDGGNNSLFYRGCNEACSFCKEAGHWKSTCSQIEIKRNLNNSKKVTQKIKPNETVAKLAESITTGKFDTDQTPIENTSKPIRTVDFGTDFGLPMSSNKLHKDVLHVSLEKDHKKLFEKISENKNKNKNSSNISGKSNIANLITLKSDSAKNIIPIFPMIGAGDSIEKNSVPSSYVPVFSDVNED
ncbi:hypothetical protein AYI69_g4476, partial [Smittium culicis]